MHNTNIFSQFSTPIHSSFCLKDTPQKSAWTVMLCQISSNLFFIHNNTNNKENLWHTRHIKHKNK